MTDAQIIERIRNGEREAYSELIARYRNMVFGLAFHHLHHTEDAHDVAQESFVRAFQHLPQLQIPARFGPWLQQIALNQCRMWRRRQHNTASLDDDELVPDKGTDNNETENAERFALQDALSCLSPASRLTVTLFYLESHSMQEIADFLDVPLTTIKSRLRNARTRLRQELKAMTAKALNDAAPSTGFIVETMRLLDSSSVLTVAYAPDGATIATGNRDGSLKLWHAATGERIRTLTGHTRPIDAVAFAPDGRTVASGSRDRTVHLWDCATGALLHTLPNEGHAASLAFSPEGLLLATTSVSRTEFVTHRRFISKVLLWETTTGKLKRELAILTCERRWTDSSKEPQEIGGAFYAVAFAPDGNEIATSNTKSENDICQVEIRLWDREGNLRQNISLDKPFVKSLAYAPDGNQLAFACLEAEPRGTQQQQIIGGEVCFWDQQTGELTSQWREALYGGVQTVAFSPDGKLLAIGYSHSKEDLSVVNHIHLREVESGKLIQVLTPDRKFHSAVAFSPDGKTLAIGNADNTLQLWDVAGY